MAHMQAPAAPIAAAALLALLCATASVQAIRRGDEVHHAAADGKFYGFADAVVTVFEPDVGTSFNITTDHEGKGFVDSTGTPLVWADAVYMESKDGTRKYVFVNSYSATQADAESFVFVFDTATDKVVAKVVAGTRPVHLYAIPELDEIWTHPDGLGTFEVMNITDTTKMAFTGIRALDQLGAHGKLIVDPDLLDDAKPVGYATNTAERFFFEIDLIGKVLIQAHNYGTDPAANISATDRSLCRGLHGIAYSPVNKHVYGECTGGGGIIEFDSVAKKVVTRWADINGGIYQTRNERFLSVTSKTHSKSWILEAGANGQPSLLRHTIDVAGNPANPIFYPKDGVFGTEDLKDYHIFWPMTNNVNKELLQRVQTLNEQGAAIDISSPEYGSKPTDCNYTGLAPGSNTSWVVAEKNCGACLATSTSTNPADWDITQSGFQYVDLATVVNGSEAATTFVPGSAIRPSVATSSTASECAFGFTYRTGIRGSKHVVMTAQFPLDSFLVVNGDNAQLLHTIATGPNPKNPTFVPQVAAVAPASGSP